MVLIEPAADDEPSASSSKQKQKQKQKQKHQHLDKTLRVDQADFASRNENELSGSSQKHEEDDWETASEGDEAEDRNDAFAVVSTSGATTESFEDALTEEEQKQRILSQANATKAEGNTLYSAGKYEDALACYTNALENLPEHETSNEIRAVCHSNSAACFFQLVQYKEAVEHSTKALEFNPVYAKALMRRGQSHEKLDNLDEALSDYQKVLELSPSNQQARASAWRLEPIVTERREKMKEEMIGKLKDLGNTVLGKFGLSVDNFKAVQDPNTGSYSISFQK